MSPPSSEFSRPSTIHRLWSTVVRLPSTVYRAILPQPSTGSALRAYFYSGWAFLIPYLAVYLLYYWQKWPANPVASLPVDGSRLTSHSPPSTVHWLPIPPLLYVYWALHVIHVVLAAVALRSWWQAATQPLSTVDCPQPTVSQSTADRLPSTAYRTALRAVTPWLLLTLVFAIPGVYLEWPADPWEHLRRITEWNTHAFVVSHSAGYKSFYFFAYSWVGWLSPSHLLQWLNVYYVSVCLLLAWQYYLLAKAVGLDRRWAFLFVLVNAFTFGNSCFSFYRYYGISTSIFAQLGAVALTRIALEYAKGIRRSASDRLTADSEQSPGPSTVYGLPGGSAATVDRAAPSPSTTVRAQLSLRRILHPPCWLHRPLPTDNRATSPRPSIVPPPTFDRLPSTGAHQPPTSYRLLFTGASLLALIAYNHVQGLGIAALGVSAIIVWRLIEWKRSTIFWLSGLALILSVATALWWPRHPLIDSAYRPQGWLTAYYGFNLFAWPSPAADRAIQIIGAAGLINLAVGVFLLWRGSVVGWLSFGPVILLASPFVALPFANLIATNDANEIIAFPRMLFAIPNGLSLVYFVSRIKICRCLPSTINAVRCRLICTTSALLAMIMLTHQPPALQRFWHLLSITPQDLRLDFVVSSAVSAPTVDSNNRLSLVATGTVTNIFNTIAPSHFPYSDRRDRIGQPTTDTLSNAVATELSSQPTLDLKCLTLVHDPLANDPSAWTTFNGPSPDFIKNLDDFPGVSTALQSPLGKRCDVFTANLIPIDTVSRYRIEFSVRQLFGTGAKVSLCVAWYDSENRLLLANSPAPTGAGIPIGWANGTYSYFGALGVASPTIWTTYRTSFGQNEEAAIPANAKFIRVGALLNLEGTAGEAIQVTNILLWKKMGPELVIDGVFSRGERMTIVAPAGRMITSCTSQAAQASLHWPPNQVMTDLAGGMEMIGAARKAKRVVLDPDYDLTFVPQ